MQADRLEVEEFDSIERNDGGINVARHPEIDDEPALGADDRTRADDRRTRAGDDHVRIEHGAGEVTVHDQAVLGTERVATPGRREDAQHRCAAIAKGCDRGGRVLAGAHHEHPGDAPVRDAARGELQGEPHEGAPGATDGGARLDPAAGLRRALEELLDAAGCGAIIPGPLERATNLAGDFVLADNDGLESARNGEQVRHDLVTGEHRHGVAQVDGCHSTRSAHRIDDRGGRRCDRVFVHLEIGLEAIAGSQDDGTAHRVGRRDELGSGILGGEGQLLEQVEARVSMVCGEAQEHLLMLVACLCPKPTLC